MFKKIFELFRGKEKIKGIVENFDDKKPAIYDAITRIEKLFEVIKRLIKFE